MVLLLFSFCQFPFDLIQKGTVQLRPPFTFWFIITAPFITLAAMAAGWMDGLAILFLAHVAFFTTMFVPSYQGFGPVITRFTTRNRAVWLTIDDGPDPATTPGILALLKRSQVQATFFLIGEKIRKHPDLVRQIIQAGHTIGNHTQTHPTKNFWRMRPNEIEWQIDAFTETVTTFGINTSLLFRSPAGIKSPFLHPILAQRDLRLIGWNCRAYDTRLDNPNEIVRRLMRSVEPGSIILFHEAHRPAVCLAALDQLLIELAVNCFNCVLPEDMRTGEIRNPDDRF
jgi:peptidoglycan-N-acetylglucosamine deacetylase